MNKELRLELIKILQELTNCTSYNLNKLYFEFRKKNKLSTRDTLILRSIIFEENEQKNAFILKKVIKKLKNLRTQS